MPLHKVTCVPRGHALGVVRHCFVNGCVGTHAFTDVSAAGR